MEKTRKLEKFCLVLLIAFLALFLGVAAVGNTERMPFNNEETTQFNEGWFYVTPKGEQEPITLPARLTLPTGAPVTITRTIPDHMAGPTVLCLRSSQQSVQVTFNGVHLYSFGTNPDQRPFGNSPGSVWNMVRLPEGSGGGTVAITLTSPYATYTGVVHDIRVGTKASLVFYLLSTYMLSLILTLIIFIGGVIMILVYRLLLRKNGGGKEMEYLGWFAVGMSLWMFGESRLVQFVLGNQFLSLCITFVSMMLTPIAAIKYIGSFREFKYKRLLGWLERLLYIQVAVVTVLQFFNLCDFVQIMPVLHTVLITACGITVGALMVDWLRNHNRHLQQLALSLVLLTLCMVFEIVWLYVTCGSNTGDILRIGVLMFLVVQARLALQKAVRVIRLSRMASVDSLTGCLNRTAYIHRLMEMDNTKEVTVMMADLNDLKIINDTQGHAVGDDALIRCGHCLSQSFGDYGECYRIGGDEFIFLGAGISREQIRALTASFDEACAREQAAAAYPFVVAHGTALFDARRDQTLSDTVRRADRLMYRQKRMLKKAAAPQE